MIIGGLHFLLPLFHVDSLFALREVQCRCDLTDLTLDLTWRARVESVSEGWCGVSVSVSVNVSV